MTNAQFFDKFVRQYVAHGVSALVISNGAIVSDDYF